MREVGDRLAVLEGIDVIPDTVPADLSEQYNNSFAKDLDADLVAR
jgi:hypothetical protein